MDIHELTSYLDEYLQIGTVPDYAPALNGLQVENSGSVSRIAAAVDASEASIRQAIKRGCDLMLVHHGMFWDGNQPVTQRRYRRLKQLLTGDVAVYSAHLPLDVHPEVGNNAQLARALGIQPQGTFGKYQNIEVGVWGELNLTRETLAARLDDVLGGRVRMLAGGKEKLKRVGVITGGAGSMIIDAARAQLDSFVTGEGTHHTYFDAMESGINVYYGGHYATETFGVKALAEHLAEKFGLEWEFIDLPTGL
ncbi:MAG TPA: Nif3-like dinuclear metal center hexameric protein [Longimicrobiales bacterium]